MIELSALWAVGALSNIPLTDAQPGATNQSITNVNQVFEEADGSFVAVTFEGGLLFVGRSAGGKEDSPLRDLIDQSKSSGRSIEITYNLDAAELSDNRLNLLVPICSVRLSETLVMARGGCVASSPHSLDSSTTQIARAMAARSEQRPEDAVREASAAIDSGSLDEQQMRMALRTRITATKMLADVPEPRSQAFDRLMLAVVRDTERVARLKPSADIAVELSTALRSLGDYERAKEVIDDAAKEFPDRDIAIDYERSALARQVDEPAESLSILNAMFVRHGTEIEGMRFHYHLGWTLTNLGRLDEAIAEFTIGIRNQPDYPYAYFRRACAYGRLGYLDRARSDLVDGAGMVEDLPDRFVGAAQARDRERAQFLASSLAQDIAAGRTAPRPDVCDGYVAEPDRPRTRSRVLSVRGG